MTTNQTGSRCEPKGSERNRSGGQCEQILAVIRRRSRPLALSELAETIADEDLSGWQQYLDGSDAVERVRIQLHHVDLPKLQRRGKIEYDSSRNLVL